MPLHVGPRRYQPPDRPVQSVTARAAYRRGSATPWLEGRDFEAEHAGCGLDLAHVQHGGGIADICQDRQPAESGEELPQEFVAWQPPFNPPARPRFATGGRSSISPLAISIISLASWAGHAGPTATTQGRAVSTVGEWRPRCQYAPRAVPFSAGMSFARMQAFLLAITRGEYSRARRVRTSICRPKMRP